MFGCCEPGDGLGLGPEAGRGVGAGVAAGQDHLQGDGAVRAGPAGPGRRPPCRRGRARPRSRSRGWPARGGGSWRRRLGGERRVPDPGRGGGGLVCDAHTASGLTSIDPTGLLVSSLRIAHKSSLTRMADVASIHFEDCPTSSITLLCLAPVSNGLIRLKFAQSVLRAPCRSREIGPQYDRAGSLKSVPGRGLGVVSPRSPIVGPERARPWKRTAEPFLKDFTEPVGSGLCFPDICRGIAGGPIRWARKLLLQSRFWPVTNPAQAELSEGAVRLRDCFPGTVPALAELRSR